MDEVVEGVPVRMVLPVPAILCESCRMCCRFTDPFRAPWAVRVGEIPGFPAGFSAPRPLRLDPCPDSPDIPLEACSGLDRPSHRCTFWGGHPADCRIYPLLLVIRENAFRLVLDSDCPFSSIGTEAFFREQAERFQEDEWKALSPREMALLEPFARAEDRPHYREVLCLPDLRNSPARPYW